MFRIILSCLILIVSENCLAQRTVEDYKIIVDQEVLTEVDTATFKKIKCKTYEAKGVNDTNNYAGDYVSSKKISLKNIEWILFHYNYYLPELNYEFHFFTGVDMKGKFMATKSTLKKIFPECILRNQVCKLTSKDSAIAIARKNGIKYPYNLYITLEKPKNSNDFFWAIDSQDSAYINYNKPLSNGLDHSIMPWKEANTRLINASTGQLISLREYYVLDK